MAPNLRNLFSTFKIGEMELKNRLAMAPIGGFFPIFDGALRSDFCEFILTRARGGVGMIILADAGLGFTNLDIEIDPNLLKKMISAAEKLVKEVHQEDVRIGVQIHHSGRQIDFFMPHTEIIAPSAIPWSKKAPIPKELTIDEIENLINRYVKAAEHAKEAGFDFVEVKACHGYLLSSFLSPHSNKRNDVYGGTIENRARITIEIIRKIKEKLGKNFLVSCRFNGSDHVQGGLNLEEAKIFAHLLIEAGADFLNISAGVYGSYPVIVPPYDIPPGCYIYLAEAIKKEVNAPILAVGRINDPIIAEEFLNNGKADIICMGRALIADPDLPNKAKAGKFEDIRKCIACNQGCQDKLGGIESTCLVNPAAGKERYMQIIPSPIVKKVLVVGGGLAGMEAAKFAALRGHKVHLYEKEKDLGGQWKIAAAPPGKEGFLELTKYLCRQLQKLGIKIILGKRVTSKIINEENPDVVILATGSKPVMPKIDIKERNNIIMARDVLLEKFQIGGQVIIIGGNALGLETAAFLATKGKRVKVIEMRPYIGTDLGPTVRWHLRHKLNELKVEIMTSTRVKSIDKNRVFLVKEGKIELEEPFDNMIIAAGAKSDKNLARKLKNKVRELYIIGDAAKPRNGLWAIREGMEIGLKI